MLFRPIAMIRREYEELQARNRADSNLAKLEPFHIDRFYRSFRSVHESDASAPSRSVGYTSILGLIMQDLSECAIVQG